MLLALLGGVFLRGFTEAIGIAVTLVGVYLALNVVVIAVSIWHVVTEPSVVGDWSTALTTQHGDPLMIIALSLLVFPKLALGMSGFETGVAVMTHVHGDPGDTEENPAGRVRGTKRMLAVAAAIMSVFLVTSSFVTTLLIPAAEFQDGGKASGRALAYLAHGYLGNGFGSVYDVSTIAILWFAGASAMAGLLNLIPKYLPRYGMAPSWARAVRPLVLLLTAVAFLVTWIFKADVNAQGGAYATGVLVLFTSAGAAVTLAARRTGQRKRFYAFAVITLVFVYTTVDNVFERPDGVKIGGLLHRRHPRRLVGFAADPLASSCAPPTYAWTRRPTCSCATAPAARSGWSPTSPTRATARSTTTSCARSGVTTTWPTTPTSFSSR